MKHHVALNLTLSLVMCFSAGCASLKGTVNYDALNRLAAKDYAIVELLISVEKDGEILEGRYKTTETADGFIAEYTYEKFATFGEEAGQITIPESRKRIYWGSATVAGNRIVEKRGDELDLPIERLTPKKFSFDETYFNNVIKDTNGFSATVTNVSAFFGQNPTVSSMEIEVRYTSVSFTSITVEYALGGTETVLTYRFDL